MITLSETFLPPPSPVLAESPHPAQQPPAEHLHQQLDAVPGHGALDPLPDLQLRGARPGRKRDAERAAAVPDLQ